MRDARVGAEQPLRVVDDLRGVGLAAVAYGPNGQGTALVRLNHVVLANSRRALVVSWACREIAGGKRVSWLLATDLAALN